MIVVAAAALWAGLLSVAPAAGIPREQFCAPQELVRYGPPPGLPPLRAVPTSGKLGFGPGQLRLVAPPEFSELDGMASTTQGIRFELLSVGRRGRLKLGWQVESRLTVIGGTGKSGKLGGARLQRVAGVGARGTKLGFRPGTVRAGLYRIDLIFRAEDGERLGRYSEYVNVVAPVSEYHLALSGSAFVPGEAVFARLHNEGTEGLRSEDDYSVDRFENGTWVPVLSQPAVAVGTSATPPGMSGDCDVTYVIPGDARPGTYRLTKGLFTTRPIRAASTTAEFAVEPLPVRP